MTTLAVVRASVQKKKKKNRSYANFQVSLSGKKGPLCCNLCNFLVTGLGGSYGVNYGIIPKTSSGAWRPQ